MKCFVLLDLGGDYDNGHGLQYPEYFASEELMDEYVNHTLKAFPELKIILAGELRKKYEYKPEEICIKMKRN